LHFIQSLDAQKITFHPDDDDEVYFVAAAF
jgi:hypothetical protein